MGTCLAAKLSPIRVATSYNTAYQQGFQHLHTSSSLGGQEQSVNCRALVMPQANLRQPKEGPTRKDDIRASGVGSTADARVTFVRFLPPPPPPNCKTRCKVSQETDNANHHQDDHSQEEPKEPLCLFLVIKT